MGSTTIVNHSLTNPELTDRFKDTIMIPNAPQMIFKTSTISFSFPLTTGQLASSPEKNQFALLPFPLSFLFSYIPFPLHLSPVSTLSP